MLFLAWLLEAEQQAGTGTWSPRNDLPPPSGYRPIFSYKVANDYQGFLVNDFEREFMDDRRVTDILALGGH